MSQQSDLLEQVVNELEGRHGQLMAIARGAGMSYDTVLRIKNREGDPGYAKVRALANYLFESGVSPGTEDAPDVPASEPAPQEAA